MSDDEEKRGRWQDPQTIVMGVQSYVVAKLRSDVQLTPAQLEYGLVAVLTAPTDRELAQLVQWQDAKAADWEAMISDEWRERLRSPITTD